MRAGEQTPCAVSKLYSPIATGVLALVQCAWAAVTGIHHDAGLEEVSGLHPLLESCRRGIICQVGLNRRPALIEVYHCTVRT